jgi:glycosyltransferase involved in cell wall biosynthesis
MQNVLFFLFRLYGGGAERVVSNLSMDLADHYNIKIAIFDNEEEVYPYRGQLIRIKLPFSKNTADNKLLARVIRLLVLVYKLRKIKKQHQIDVTISFAEQANIINVLTKGRTRIILSVRTFLSRQILDTPNSSILKFLIKFLYNRADLIITPSKVSGLDLVKHFGILHRKLKVIYNYIDQEKIIERSQKGIEDCFHQQLFELPILLNVGRITPAKGQWLLMELMKKIKIQFPGWKLVIMGETENEGQLRMQLTELAADLDLKLYDSLSAQEPSLDYDVYLLGFQLNPFRYMRKSKILLFPSVFEGFPNTVLEAMQSGLPVIVADCHAGPREILAPETDLEVKINIMELTQYGILCPALTSTEIKLGIAPDLLDEWMNAVSIMINEPEMKNRLIQNGYTRVSSFEKKFILQEWKDCMELEQVFPGT